MKRVGMGLLVIAVAPVLLGLSNQLHDYDPAQYAEVARRMLACGEWLDLRDAWGPFTNKPPLTMWAQAAMMALMGVTSVAARLPILLFGLLALWATFLIGKELWDARTGRLAAVGLGASVAFHHMVADPKVDMPLLAFTALSIAALLVSRRRPAAIWLAWACAGLAVLSKGPVGLVLPMAAVGPELLRPTWLPGTTLWQRLAAMKLVRGLLLVVAITAPFYVVVYLRSGADAASYLLVHQGFGRLTGTSGWNDNTTPFFFVHTGAWAFFPMTAWLLVGLGRRAVAFMKARAFPGAVERVALFWLAIPLVAISLSTYKLPQYVYWLSAPASLLAARELTQVSPRAAVWWRWGAAALGVVALLAVWASSRWLFPASPWWLVGVAVVQLSVLWFIRAAETPERVLGAMVAVTSSLFVFFHGSFHRSLLAFQPGEAMAAWLREKEPTERSILVIGDTPTHSLAYYAERDLAGTTPDQLHAQLVATGPAAQRWVVLSPGITDEQLADGGLQVTERQSFDSFLTSMPSRRFLLASSRPDTLVRWQVVRVAATRGP